MSHILKYFFRIARQQQILFTCVKARTWSVKKVIENALCAFLSVLLWPRHESRQRKKPIWYMRGVLKREKERSDRSFSILSPYSGASGKSVIEFSRARPEIHLSLYLLCIYATVIIMDSFWSASVGMMNRSTSITPRFTCKTNRHVSLAHPHISAAATSPRAHQTPICTSSLAFGAGLAAHQIPRAVKNDH